MATLLELRRRVRSVKNMRQITRAMKLVSGAKLRRAQDAMLAARPYSDKMWEVLGGLAQVGDDDVETAESIRNLIDQFSASAGIGKINKCRFDFRACCARCQGNSLQGFG